MALIQTWVNCSLGELVKMQYLDGNLFSMDNQGNLIGVNVYDRNGDPAELQGSVSANVLRPNGDMVSVSGSRDRNRCSVILPQACYSYPGSVIIIIKLTDNNSVTTLAAVAANIYQSTYDPVVDPGTIVPSIQDLIDRISAIEESIPSDYTALCATVAQSFNTSTSYSPGQYVIYNNGLYLCTTAHSGSWNASHFQSVTVGSEITKLANEIHILEPAATSGDVGKFLKVKSVANGKVTEYEFADAESGGGTFDYNDLTNKPSINNITLSGNKSLNDLGVASKSSVTAVENSITTINADLNILKPAATSSDIGKVPVVKTVANGKVTAYEFGEGGGGGTSDYSDLSNKPSINSITLSGNKSLNDLGIASQTALSALDERVAELEYKPLTLNSLSVSPSAAEIGSTIATATLTYSMNKAATLMQLDNTNISNTAAS